MNRSLERSLGFWSVFSISAGAMISGIFVLPGLAAGKAGPAATLAYFVAGLLALPAALSKAELATGIPATGGTYVYLDRSMGPLMGTIGGLGAWFSLVFKSAFALVGLGVYLSLLLPLSAKYTALVLCTGLILINIAGVKKTTKLQIGIIVCVFTSFAVFIGRGVTAVSMDHYTPFLTHGWGGFLATTGFVFISYAGVTKIASVAEEVSRPNRNIPLGILSTLGVMIVVHVLIVWILVGTVPLAELGKDLTPIATAAGELLGGMGHVIWAAVAVLALTSMANAGLLSSSRYPYAMSRDRLLPTVLERVHPRFRTPVVSILLTGGLMLFLIGFMNVESLAKLGSAFMLLAFALVNLSVIIFRESEASWYRPRFRCPGYPWVQLAGIGTNLLLIATIGSWLPLLGVAVITLASAAWYLLYARRRVDRVGTLAQLHSSARQLQQATENVDRRHYRRPVLVPFVGDETEPEIRSRLQIANLLSVPEKQVHPVYFEEAPDETLVEVLRSTSPEEERFVDRLHHAMQQWEGLMTLETLITHDAKAALFRHARSIEARWIVMGWQRKSTWNFLIRAHRYWWLHHSPSSVAQYLHRNTGEIQQIVVAAEPGPHDTLIVHVADQLGLVFDAQIVLLHVLEAGASESQFETVEKYHAELQQLFRCKVENHIVCGPNRLDAALKETETCDLLILGAPAEATLRKLVAGSFEDRLAEKASCSVLQLQSLGTHARELIRGTSHETRAGEFGLSAFLHQGVVQARLEMKDKQALFAHLASHFAKATGVATVSAFAEAFWQREEMQNTAMGDGVAMPHAVIPELEQTYLGVFTLRHPVDFDSPGRQLVDICIATVGPPGQRNTHLRILGRVAYLIREANLLAQLREVDSNAQLSDVVMTCDAATP